ncbi:His Kinase A (phospho-acceptor) domain-containing protein [Lachnospiraceae bacterium XBB1006]|nr:His Kinase A (phospho-acceptor) domain-containing protein [Lachnospiraceae bacterium XBB1006]
MKQEYQQLLQTLDRILAGEPVEEHFDETMDAAIADRVKRIMGMVLVRQEQAESERDKVKRLISDIGHQIRTPLANITLYTGLLQERLEKSEDAKLAEKIANNAQTLSFHVQELLKASYAEQELICVRPEKAAVADIVQGAGQRVEGLAMDKGISMRIDCGKEMALADKKWTEEALFNVLHNAVKYSEVGSEIVVETEGYESFVCIRVKDEGIGIPEEETGAVCGRFYRGSNVTKEKGLGIGLYLTREVLRRQQGYLKITSKIGKGTTVALYLLREE